MIKGKGRGGEGGGERGLTRTPCGTSHPVWARGIGSAWRGRG